MKNILIKLVAMVLVMSFLGVPTSFASEEISVKINGETLIFDVPPQIVDGRTMVPMRTIFEALGASIEWYGETKTIIAKKAEKTIKVTIGKKEISINEKITEMDVAPVIIDSRTLVPARFVAEALGAEVSWDGDTKTVNILQKDQCGVTQTRNEFEESVLDYGKCGDNLNWELLADGTLHIFGEGPMYDYVKSDPELQSPWYKYRKEPYISDDGLTVLNSDGSEYMPVSACYSDNPNGWYISNIIIDEGVTYIGNWAFYRVCVDSITIPEGVTEMGHFCIRYSPTLQYVNLPDSLILMDDFAISRNIKLKSINFGNSLETIGLGGFAGNTSMTKLILPDSVTSIHEKLSSGYLPDYLNDEIGTGRGTMFLSSPNLTVLSLGNIDKIPQRAFMDCTALTSVVIPNSVTEIEEYAFYRCTQLSSISFESGSRCKNINQYALKQCPIESITGASALETIQGNAFNNGNATLREFEFSDSNVSFQGFMFKDSMITEATLGPNVTQMSSELFNGSAIETLNISGNLVEIKAAALMKCANLTTINYDGTLEDWNNITVANEYWCSGTYNNGKNCTVYFNDGTSALLKDVRQK